MDKTNSLYDVLLTIDNPPPISTYTRIIVDFREPNGMQFGDVNLCSNIIFG